MSGLFGCIRILGICLEFLSPTEFQLRPPSTDLYIPVPGETFPRTVTSPPPT